MVLSWPWIFRIIFGVIVTTVIVYPGISDWLGFHQNVEEPGSDVYFTEAATEITVVSQRDTVSEENQTPEGPIAVASDDVRTSRRSVTFDASGSQSPSGEELRYYWDFGDGNYREGEIVVHRYDYGGEFEAVLTVDDQRGLESSQDHDTVNVFINRPPEVFFEMPFVTCVGDTITFDGSMTYDPDGGDLLYEWDFGDGSIARSKEGEHVFNEIGQYEVTLTVDDNEGLDNSVSDYTHEITVVGAPSADAGSEKLVCAGEPTQFDGSGSSAAHDFINEFRWDFGDGGTGGGEQPMYTYEAPGIYDVHLEVMGSDYGDCPNTATDSTQVEVVTPASAEFNLPEVAAKDDELRLDPTPSLGNGADVRAITWELDTLETIEWHRQRMFDGEETTSQWVKYSKESAGNITKDEEEMESGLPVAYRSLPAGDYNISMQVETDSPSPCNVDVSETWITVEEEPEIAMEDIPVLVPGENHWFQADQTGSSFDNLEWDFDDGNFATGPEVEYAYNEPGVYEVRLFDEAGGDEIQQEQVRVNAPPEAVISGPFRLEPGDRGTWSADESSVADGEIERYEWFFSDGYRTEGKEVEREFDQPGTYSVTLIVEDDAGVENSVQSRSETLVVGERPDVTSEIPAITCPDVELDLAEGLSLEPRDSSAVDIYVGERRVNYADAQGFSLQYPGTYTIRAVESGGSISESSDVMMSHRLTINGQPEIHAEVPSEMQVDGLPGRFDASNSFDPDGNEIRHRWDLGDGTIREGEVIEHNYDSAGTYEVTLTVMDARNLTCSVTQEEFTVEVTP